MILTWEQNALQSNLKKMLSIHTLYGPCKECPSSITHTHIYSLLLPLRWSEEKLSVFMLPTVVLEHGWMEVKPKAERDGGASNRETDVQI